MEIMWRAVSSIPRRQFVRDVTIIYKATETWTWTDDILCVRRCWTTSKTWTIPVSCASSRSMSRPMNVPVRPTPALQWTKSRERGKMVLRGSTTIGVKVRRTWRRNANSVHTSSGTPLSGQTRYCSWVTCLRSSLWGNSKVVCHDTCKPQQVPPLLINFRNQRVVRPL